MKKIIVFPLIWIWTILPVFGQTHFKITGGNLKVTDDVNITLHNTKWVNNGTFNATDGAVIFNGDAATSDATIEGSSETQFYDLKIDKTANNVELGINTKVIHQLNLQSGLLDIGEFDIDFGTAGFTVFVNNQTYILTSGIGKVIRQIQNGNSANFIVGDGSCTPMIIQNSGTSDEFSVRVVAEVLDNGTSGNAFTGGVVNRTWYVEELADGGTDLTLTAQWNESDELTGFDRNSCYLSHFDGGWDMQVPGAAIGNDPYQISRSNIIVLSPFAVTSGMILPVELLGFQAFQRGKNVELNWQTANEINNALFIVERSLNGVDFMEISQMEGAGNHEGILDYQAIDEHPQIGINYYRLQQVDFDGTATFSEIETVRFETDDIEVVLYPNPAKDFVELRFSEEFSIGNTTLMDVSGRILRTEEFEHIQVQQINLSGLVAGIYFIKIENEAFSKIMRLVVE